jgi:hypothetical protein
MLRMRRDAKKMYIVTGRQDVAREQTELWVDRHFPGIFDDVILTNSYTPMEVKKVDICRSLALDTIIDDSIDTCLECMEKGMNVIHFVGDEVYPWCEESDISMRGWMEDEIGPKGLVRNGKEIKMRSVGPLVKGKRTVASRLGWRNSGQRTLETLCTGFVKFVKRSSDSVTWNGVRVTASLGTRHSLKHRVSPRLRRVVFPRLRP